MVSHRKAVKSGPVSYADLDAMLAKGRARLWLHGTLVALGLALGAFSALTLLGALALGVHPSGAIRWAFLALMASALGTGPIWGVVGSWRSGPSSVAARISRSDPRLRSLLLSAVELRSLGPETRGLSTVLIEAQAGFAMDRAKRIDLREAIPTGPSRACLALGIGSLLITGLTWRYGPPVMHRGFGVLRRLPDAAHPGMAAEPITGDIELTYSYPAHTHLAQRSVAGTNGEIDVPAGTQVSLRTRADRAVTQAQLIVNGIPQALAISGDRLLSGSFVVSRPGSYFFRFGPVGHPIAEGPPIAIAVQADAPPQISLEAPPEELEVEPKEIVELRYQASDDYGLSEIRLVYRLPGAQKESSVSLRKLDEPPLRLDGTARFDLGPLHLMAGDQLSYALEALDNDDVQGPKLGRSRPHVLKIFSPAEHHREALARMRALWERLLGLLGDRLDEAETPRATDASGTDARAMQLCQDLEHEARQLLKDSGQEKGIAIALRNVARAEGRRASATSDERDSLSVSPRVSQGAPDQASPALNEEINGLERDVSYLEALLDQATTDDLSALLRELTMRRLELSELLERYREHPTPELKEQIMALFDRLKARSAELASRMQQLAKGLSNQPHLNLEALPKGIGSNLSQVEQALAAADIDQALKSLDQLAGQLDTLQSELERSRGGEREENRELAQKLKDFKDDLDEVQRDQTKIASEIDSLLHETRKALERRAPATTSMLDELRSETQRAKAQLDQIPQTGVARALIGDDSLFEAKDRTAELDRALQSKDLDQALRSAEQALHAVGSLREELDRYGIFRSLAGRPTDDASAGPNQPAAQARLHLQQATTPLQSVRDKLQKLFPDEKSLLGPEQREHLSRLEHEQNRAQERTQGLSQKLDQIGKEAPVFDPSARDALHSAESRMREAGKSLGQGEPGQASEEDHGALEQLDRLSKAMSHSRGGRGGGVPNPFSLGQNDGEGDSDGSPGAASREPVVVPGADQYQVPAQFRRDILDAMKQRAPKPYEDQVKQYYQEIVK